MRLRLFLNLLLAATTLLEGLSAAADPGSDGQRVRNPIFDRSESSILRRQLSPQQYRAWVTHPPDERLAPTEQAHAPVRGAPQFATALRGEILVVEGDSDLVLDVNADGTACTATNCKHSLNHGGGAVQVIADHVMETLGDRYDSIVVWTVFEDTFGGAYYAALKNDVDGLGICEDETLPDAQFGCIFDAAPGVRAQGLIYMNSVETWKLWDARWNLAYTEYDMKSQVYSTLAQETAHRWLVGFHLRNPDGGGDDIELLGRGRNHYNMKVDADGSVMDGLDWVPLESGGFQIVAVSERFSMLDLYAMGLVPAGEVPPFFIVRNAHSERLKYLYGLVGYTITGDIPDSITDLPIPAIEVVGPIDATGDRFDVTIDDIIEANGPRIPSDADSPKVFNQVFVLVTLPGQTIEDAQPFIDQLELVRTMWERWFSEMTLGHGQICTEVSGDCSAPMPEVRGLRIVDDGDGQWERGETVNAPLTIANAGTKAIATLNAVLSTDDVSLTIESAGVQMNDITAGSVVESAPGFRVRLAADVDCAKTEVAVHVATDPAGATTEGKTLALPIKPCPVPDAGHSDAFDWAPAACGCEAVETGPAPWGVGRRRAVDPHLGSPPPGPGRRS